MLGIALVTFAHQPGFGILGVAEIPNRQSRETLSFLHKPVDFTFGSEREADQAESGQAIADALL